MICENKLWSRQWLRPKNEKAPCPWSQSLKIFCCRSLYFRHGILLSFLSDTSRIWSDVSLASLWRRWITQRPSEHSRRLKNNEINEKNLTRATVGSSQEIWCSNRETGRFDEKLGDSRENRESWQVCWIPRRTFTGHIRSYLHVQTKH